MSEELNEKFKFDQFKRNIYFYGKLLTVDDFENEQEYFRLKNKLNNKYLHGKGIVHGLKVTNLDSDTVKISPGFAIDSDGNEIIVSEKMNRTKDIDFNKGECCSLCIEYFEEECDEFPVSFSPEKKDNLSRIKENFKLSWQSKPSDSSIKIAEVQKESGEVLITNEKREIKSNSEFSNELSNNSKELQKHEDTQHFGNKNSIVTINNGEADDKGNFQFSGKEGIKVNKKEKQSSIEISIDPEILKNTTTNLDELDEHKKTQHFGNKNSIVTINNGEADDKGNFQFSGGEGIEIKRTKSSIVISISPKIIDNDCNISLNDLFDLKTSFESIKQIVPKIRENLPSKGFLCKKINNTYLNDVLIIINRCNDFFIELSFNESYFNNDIESVLSNIEKEFKEIDSIFLNKKGEVSEIYYDATNKHNEINSKYKISNKERNLYTLYLDFISVYNQDIYMKKSGKELCRYNISIKRLNGIIQEMLIDLGY